MAARTISPSTATRKGVGTRILEWKGVGTRILELRASFARALVGLHKPELEKQATTQKSTLQGQRTKEDTRMVNCKHLIAAAEKLRDAVNSLTFSPPITHVYNPLDYAWESPRLYLTRFGNSTKKVVLLGMNPGRLCPFLPL